MKFLANIVLFLFLSFLAAPTVVALMEDKADISMAYSLTEEEMQKELAEVKYSPSEFHYVLLSVTKKTSEIKTENLQRHDNVFEEIFSPPPEEI